MERETAPTTQVGAVAAMRLHTTITPEGIAVFSTLQGSVVAYVGWAGAIADLSALRGWKAFGSPTQAAGCFITTAPGFFPEDLPIDPGTEGWLKMTSDEVAEFAC